MARMETPEGARRQSDTLPSISYLEFERTAQESALFRQRHPSVAARNMSIAAPVSPTTMYAQPPPSHSHASENPSNVSQSGYISPPNSRRTSENEDETKIPPPSHPRGLSLPSLHEAIFESNENSFSQPPSSSSVAPPLCSPSSLPPSTPIPRSHPQQPLSLSQPPSHLIGNPHSSVLNAPNGYRQDRSKSQPITSAQLPPHDISYPPSETRHGSLSYAHSERKESQPSAPPPMRPPDPAYGAGPAHSQPSDHGHYESRNYGPPMPPSSIYSQPPQHNPPLPYPHSVPQNPTSRFPQPYPSQRANSYPNDSYSRDRPESLFSPKSRANSNKTFQDPYGSAINRALDISDLRRELDLIRDNSSHLYHFAMQYTPQGHQQAGLQTPKFSGQTEPSMHALEDALAMSIRTTQALEFWKSKVLADQSIKQEQQQMSSMKQHKSSMDYTDEDGPNYGEESKPNGNLPPDPKKQRRGKAAPPGRCHSCNRAETPEWRRGPDGARTLCNACGLHYAKLTRKLSKSNTSLNNALQRKSTSSASTMS